MNERTLLFYRCPGWQVGFDAVFVDGEVKWLDSLELCPLCGTPVLEHSTFILLARRDKRAVDER